MNPDEFHRYRKKEKGPKINRDGKGERKAQFTSMEENAYPGLAVFAGRHGFLV
jgi:hypothetical protein